MVSAASSIVRSSGISWLAYRLHQASRQRPSMFSKVIAHETCSALRVGGGLQRVALQPFRCCEDAKMAQVLASA